MKSDFPPMFFLLKMITGRTLFALITDLIIERELAISTSMLWVSPNPGVSTMTNCLFLPYRFVYSNSRAFIYRVSDFIAALAINFFKRWVIGLAWICPLSFFTILAPYRYCIVVDFPDPVVPNSNIMSLPLSFSELEPHTSTSLKNS